MNAFSPSLRNDRFVSFISGMLVAALMLVGGPTAWAATLGSGACCDESPPLVSVEESTPMVLTPTEQVTAIPENQLEHIVILDEQDMPEGWSQPVSTSQIPASAIEPAATLTVSVTSKLVAAMFWDGVGTQPRYGCGIRTEVVITNSGSIGIDRAGTFKLIREVGSQSEAVAVMEQTWNAAQANPTAGIDAGVGAGDGGIPGSTYSLCVQLCLDQAFDERWAVFADCMELVGLAGVAVAAACCKVCLLTNVAFVPCMTACLGDLALLLGIPLAMLTGTCFAVLIASLTAAILVCRLGCIGV